MSVYGLCLCGVSYVADVFLSSMCVPYCSCSCRVFHLKEDTLYMHDDEDEDTVNRRRQKTTILLVFILYSPTRRGGGGGGVRIGEYKTKTSKIVVFCRLLFTVSSSLSTYACTVYVSFELKFDNYNYNKAHTFSKENISSIGHITQA